MQGQPVEIEARGLTKAFGERVVVRDVSLRLRPGVVHALLGENGAGKSTVLKMLAGVLEPTSGEVLIGGTRLEPSTPLEATRRGVGMVHQHFSLVPSFTALENLMLGHEPVGPMGVLRPRELEQRVRDVAKRTGLEVPLERSVAEMSVGERQRLEILRVLVRGARALLLDEPTAVLTPQEATGLYELLSRVAAEGSTVAVVTHHLREVLEHATEVTVLRRGELVHHGPVAGHDYRSLSRCALGEVPVVGSPEPIGDGAAVVLSLEGLGRRGDVGQAIEGVSLEVRAGEIVGVAGIDGNGQEALVSVIAGLEQATSGRVLVAGRDVTTAPVHERRRAGLEVVHGDRHRFGLVSAATVGDNLVLGDLGEGDESSLVKRRLEASGAVPQDASVAAATLSGGNQQKLVVARALDRTPRALVVAYPTRGVDAAASASLRARVITAAQGGAAVLLVSNDLGEIRALSHRIVVLAKGRIVATLPRDATEQQLGRAMLGEHT